MFLKVVYFGLLRDELGYDGVVISDALDMQAITDGVGLTRGAVRSLAAGADLLCLGPAPSEDDVERIVDEIVASVGYGGLPLSRLEEAASRVDRLRAWFGSFSGTPGARDVVGLHAARRAVRLTGAVEPLVDPFVVEVDTPPNIAAGDVPWGIAPWLPAAEIVRLRAATANPSDLLSRAAGRSLVVLLKDAHRYADSQALVSALVTARPDAIVIELGLPVWRPDTATYIATYGAARANTQAAAELLTA